VTPPRPRTRATSARLRPSATADRTVCGLLRAAVCTAGSTSGRGTTARIAGDTAAAASAVSDVAAARQGRHQGLLQGARGACPADRTPAGPQIVLSSPPCLRRYAAGYYLLGQGGGRPGGGFTAVWGSCRRRGGLSRASSRCRAGVPARAWRRARRRFVADDDGPLGRARRARARLGWARPPGGRRVEGECVRAACSRSCACVCGGRWGGRAAGWRAASAAGSPPVRFFCVWLSCMHVLSM